MVALRRWLPALALVAASCARQPAPDVALRPNADPRVISWLELRDPAIQAMDALKAIRTLRPAFIRPMGPTSFRNANAGQLHYSMDFGPLRPISELSTITTAMLIEIRYLDQNDAQNRFGINANGGPVIVLLNSKAP